MIEPSGLIWRDDTSIKFVIKRQSSEICGVQMRSSFDTFDQLIFFYFLVAISMEYRYFWIQIAGVWMCQEKQIKLIFLEGQPKKTRTSFGQAVFTHVWLKWVSFQEYNTCSGVVCCSIFLL
jgi:hypothetical protein